VAPAVTGPASPRLALAGGGPVDVVVVGGGVAGLVCARDLATAGRRVVVLEASDRPGGCVAPHTVAGLVLDAGAESFATRSPAVGDLLGELGLDDAVVAPEGAGAWVRLARRSVPLPRTGVVGIPADPWSPEVRAAIGIPGALRASLDRLLPARVGTRARARRDGGHGSDDAPGPTLATLVRARAGRRVLNRLVAPVVGGVHSVDPGVAGVEVVAPGLVAAVRSTGSLSGAVRSLRSSAGSRSGRRAGPQARPGAAVAGVDGGMHRLVTALVDDLRRLGASVRLGQRASGVEQVAGGWRVRLDGGSTERAPDVVLAVPGPVARRLLDPGAAALPAGPVVALVTLVLDAPELDVAPRGTGVLVSREAAEAARAPVRAKALTHATAKWAWLAREAGPGRHVLRLSYGRGDGSVGDGLGDGGATGDVSVEQALADASVLLGVPLGADRLVGSARVVWSGVVPGGVDRHASRALAESVAGRWACGAWVAGQGLASVVADARDLASRVLDDVARRGTARPDEDGLSAFSDRP